MQLILDENIPFAEEFFSAVTAKPLLKVPGRDICSQVDDTTLGSANGLIIRSVTRVDEALLAKCPNLRFVGTCTIGTDHIDVSACERRGIRVVSAPGCNANSVVEYVFSALAALNVEWQKITVGIVGCGNVGGALLRSLRSLGVNCKVYDPLLRVENLEQGFRLTFEAARVNELADLLACDLLSLHTPFTETGDYPTKHLLGARELHQLKPSTILLNAGRGPVVDNEALHELLKKRDDLRVVLDVWENEPDVPLALMDRVTFASPHIAGYSFDGKALGTEMIYSALCDCLQLPKTVSLKNLLPVYSGPELALPKADLIGAELINYVILQAYDIRKDDALMRKALLHAVSREQAFGVADAFDKLRKNYAVRREFSNYVFSKELLDLIRRAEVVPVLRSLGFIL